MFAKFDKYKEVFLSPSLVFPPSFVRRQLLTNHYYLPLLPNELNKQTNSLSKFETMRAISSLLVSNLWRSDDPEQINFPKNQKFV